MLLTLSRDRRLRLGLVSVPPATGLLALLSVGSVSATRPGSAGCDPAAAGMSRAILAELVDWVTTSDTMRLRLREEAFHVPVVPPESIHIATDPAICDRAADAYARALDVVPLPVSVVELHGAGTRKWYAVYGPHARMGEFGAVLIFDAEWARTGGWTF